MQLAENSPGLKMAEFVSSPDPKQNPDVIPGISAIEGLIDQASEASHSSRPLMQPKSVSEKRKNGRPRKNPDDPKWQTESGAQPEAAPQPQIPTFDATSACRDLFKVTSRLIVTQTGVEACALHETEIESLATTWGSVANQYMPAFLAQHGPIIAACAVTAGVAIRLNQTIQSEIDRRKAEQAATVKNTVQDAKTE